MEKIKVILIVPDGIEIVGLKTPSGTQFEIDEGERIDFIHSINNGMDFSVKSYSESEFNNMYERRIPKKGDRNFVMFAATGGMRGRFAVMCTAEDGPIQTGNTCKNLEDTARYAIRWAKDEFGVDWKDHVEDNLLKFEEDEKCSDIETTEQLVSFVKDLLKTYGITYKRLYTKPCKGSKYFCGRSLKFFNLEATKNAGSFDSCISFVVILQERLGSKFKVVPVQYVGYGQVVGTYSFSIVKGE